MAEKNLWAPWRSEFIFGEKEKGCVFCKLVKAKQRSFDNLLLYRAEKTYIVMNKFPYTVGHLLIVPNRHIGGLERRTKTDMCADGFTVDIYMRVSIDADKSQKYTLIALPVGRYDRRCLEPKSV